MGLRPGAAAMGTTRHSQWAEDAAVFADPSKVLEIIDDANLDARRADLERDIAILGDCLSTARAELRGLKARATTKSQTTTTLTPPMRRGGRVHAPCPPTSPPPGAGDAPAPGAVES